MTTINKSVVKFLTVFLGMICIIIAMYIKGPSHHYIDMIEGWKCTKGTADVNTIPPDNCEQWTKL